MIKVAATVSRIVFRSPTNDFKILSTTIKENDKTVKLSVTGNLFDIKEGLTYEFEGSYTTHPKYGKQFNAFIATLIEDNSKKGIVSYLSSDYFPGIGQKTAEKIFDLYGEDCVDKIIEDKSKLESVGLSKTKIDLFYEDLLKQKNNKKHVKELYALELPSEIISILIEETKDPLEYLKKNLYSFFVLNKFITFSKAESICESIGIKLDSEERIKGNILYFIKEICNNEGHTYISKEQLYARLIPYLNGSNIISEDKVDKIFNKMINEEIIINDNKVFLTIRDKQINFIAKYIKKIVNKDYSYNNEETFDKVFSEISSNIEYSLSQKEAIKNAINSNFFILTGGPGTGKTTVLNAILKVYSKLNNIDLFDIKAKKKIALCSPTGKAAKRLQDSTSFHASTIHKLIGYRDEMNTDYNEKFKLSHELVIVDEASMIDLPITYLLLRSLKDNTKVIFVGDIDQLPSVGVGQVLKDLIETKVVPTFKLTEIHRQAEESTIIKMAYSVNKGEIIEDIYEKRDDYSFVNTNYNNGLHNILFTVKKAVESGYDIHRDIQVLIPQYKGDTGINNVNKEIQSLLNKSTNFIDIGDTRYKENDKVIQRVNDPDKGIMNGDIGRIISIKDVKTKNKKTIKIIKVEFNTQVIEFSRGDMLNLQLAYAISIHKSQGSEYNVIILPILNEYMYMLNKKLIYTAITRSKSKLIILGNIDTFSKAIEKQENQRNTYLKYAILGDDFENEIKENKKEEAKKEKKVIKLDDDLPFEDDGDETDKKITPYDFL